VHWSNNPKELRKRRKEAGVTQEQLSEAAGIKLSWLAAVETGRVPLAGPKGRAVWRALARIEERKSRKTLLSSLIDERGFAEYVSPRLLEPRETPEQVEIRKLRAQLQRLTQDFDLMKEIAEIQKEMLALHKSESGEQTARIQELEQQVTDLRNLYEAETEAALAHARAEELREKISARGEEGH